MRQAQQLARDVPLPNQHQRSIYDNVIDTIHDPKSVDKTFFVDGLGGVGKTFLYECLLSRVRCTGDIALSMASFGIAALLLEGGCTAHSRFKIPLTGLCGSSACYVPLNNPQAALIPTARLIVWDEAPMAHKHVFEVMNRTLQHVMGAVDPALKDMLFGGKVVVMGGDFRQILPVVPRGTRGQIVDASLKRSAVLWHRVKVRQLHENMRVQRLLARGGANAAADAQQQQAWVDYLQRIGEGTEQVFPKVGEEVVLIPEDMCCQGDTIDSLVDEVYSDLGCFTDSQSRNEHIIQRAILTPLNEDVDSINTAIMNRFDLTTPHDTPAQRRTYHNANSVVQGEQKGVYPHRVSKLPHHVRGATPHFDPAGRLPGDFVAEYAEWPCKWHSAYCGQADAAHN
jgi:hypothetical protein